MIPDELEFVKVSNYLPGSGALHHLDLSLVLPEAKVHHRLGRLLQRVPAATFIYIMETATKLQVFYISWKLSIQNSIIVIVLKMYLYCTGKPVATRRTALKRVSAGFDLNFFRTNIFVQSKHVMIFKTSVSLHPATPAVLIVAITFLLPR